MKRVLAILLTLILAIGLVACNKPAEATSAVTSTGTEAASEPAQAAGGDILIGCLQDITGKTSALGMSVQAGAQAAVDEINANGGINGRKVVMKTYDTKGDVTEAVNAYLAAVTVDKVTLIVGPPVANIAHAIKETSEGYDVPVLGLALDPTCQIKADGSVYKNMFCFQPSATSQGQIMGAFALKNDLKTFGVLYNQENSYSVALLNPFIETVKAGGGTVDEKLVVAYGNADTDYKTLLQPIVAAGVDAIYCPNYTQQLVSIVTAGEALGFEGKYVCGLDASPSFNTTYGADCSDVYYINNIDIFNETTKAMADSVKDKVAAINKYFLGYDIVMVAKQALETTGTEDAAALRTAFENVTAFEGLTGSITIDPTTHMPKDMGMFMYTYEGTEPKLLEQFAG